MKNFKSAESLYDLVTLSAVQSYKDSLIYVKTYFDKDGDSYKSEICQFDGRETVLVEGGVMPKVKDGVMLFLAGDDNGVKQVFTYDMDSGDVKQQTFCKDNVGYVSWADSSDSFVFTTSLENSLEGKVVEWEDSCDVASAPYYRITQLKYQQDGFELLTGDEQNFLCITSLGSSSYKVISHQATGYALRGVCSIDRAGNNIYFERRLHPQDDFNFDSGMFKYNTVSGEIEQVSIGSVGIYGESSVSPCGKYLVYVGNNKPYETANRFNLYLHNLENGKVSELSSEMDVQFADNSVSDFYQNVSNSTISWHPEGDKFYVQSSEYGRVKLYEINLEGEFNDISPVDLSVVKEYTVSSNGDVFALVSEPTCPIALYKYSGGNWSKVEHPIDSYYSDYQFGEYTEVEYKASDGGIVHGFLVTPTNFDEGKKYPIVLNIHGGPYTMHAANFYFEVQNMAANGYCTLLINPRGSHGYGQEHTYGVCGKYGQGDYTDLITGLDEALEDFDFIDRDNQFITGGSYGGYMTNWAITKTNRFNAAASQRSMTNFYTMVGVSDIGYYFFRDETGYDINSPKELWDMSPLKYADNIETPLLLIHSLKDLRCPFEQAQQLYTKLKYNDKPVELLAFPNSTHELSRAGRPSYRVARVDAMVDWFDRYLV